MEPVGLAIGLAGLAGLFSACVDVIDRVDSYKDFGVESRSIIAQFEFDKYVFKKWANAAGIENDEQMKSYNVNLDNSEMKLRVQNILYSIQEIFNRTESTMSSLKPASDASKISFPGSILSFDPQQDTLKPQGAISRRHRIGWSLRNKVKFIYQVQQFGALVQRLCSLIPLESLLAPPSSQDGTMSNGLDMRNDRTTLFQDSQRLLIEMEKQIKHETKNELNAWLGACWTNGVYDNLLQRRLNGTCNWILNRSDFVEWISTDFPSGKAKILWINGPAGYGKTILCAGVVQHLLTILESPLAYHFCSSDSETRRDPSTIMRSWISQIISSDQETFDLACGKWEMLDGRYASQTDIVELFKTIVEHTPNCTFVVDGLDECAWAVEKWKSNHDDSPIGFFESVKRAVAHTNTRILIFSRDEPEIRYGLRTVLGGDDFQRWNEYKICPDDVRSDALSFSRSIVNKKLSRMFLWVKMLEDYLRNWKNKKQLEDTIDQAPTALDRLYDRDWMKISQLPEKYKLRAFSILRWAAFSLRPLTVFEVAEALLIEDDDNLTDLLVDDLPDTIDEDYISSEILGLCGSLLETQKATQDPDLGSMTIHLAHFSVKQYIICNMPSQGGLLIANERLRVSSETFQSNILAKMCLRYLNFPRVWQESIETGSGSQNRPFRDYAAGSWWHHLGDHDANYVECVELINTFFSPKNGNWRSWKIWFDANDDKSNLPESQREISSTNPLFYASLLGLRDTIIFLVEETGVDANHVDECNRTALQAAALKGQTSMVKLLLEMGTDSNVANKEGWTALNSASDRGHIDVVKLLLENGADVTVPSNAGWTPLNVASYRGYVDIVKLLLDNGADVGVPNQSAWTPLNSASDNGQIEVVKVLLKTGADVAVPTNTGWTPLNVACRGGHTEIVKLLLENGADTNVANHSGSTPLISASLKANIDVVRLLLDRGADIAAVSNDGWTSLKAASVNGNVDVMKLLLEKGADITVKDNDGWTTLNTASLHGHSDVVKLLLEKGADATVGDDSGWTPLHSASRDGHFEIVKLLLTKGAELESKDKFDQTSLSLAASEGHEAILQLLLEKGAELESPDKWSRTPLHYASRYGHIESVKVLLDNGAELESRDYFGRSPLSLAAEDGQETVVKLLLDRGANTESKDDIGSTPLLWAAKNGHDVVVQHLLEMGAELQARNLSGNTPLLLAARSGKEAVLKLLLDRGADLESKDEFGRTPLLWAARHGGPCVELLLNMNCVGIDLKDHYRSTPLSIAARMGHRDVVMLLLAQRCAFLTKDHFNRSALWWARRTGQVDIADLLLEKYKEDGVVVQEDDLPRTIISVIDDKNSGYCDVCLLPFLENDAYYHCNICSGGTFDLCVDCSESKAHCLDQSHSLLQRLSESN